MSESASLMVTGMKCGGCENIVKAKLNTVPGIISVSASSKEKKVDIEFEPEKTDLSAIAHAITEAGYTVVDDN